MDIWSLSHAEALMGWDLETYMPPLGIEGRSEAFKHIGKLKQRIFLKNIKPLIKEIKPKNDFERGVKRVLERELHYYESIPADFIGELEKTTSKARISWRRAKEKKDFKIFRRDLKNIFELKKKEAEYLGYKKHPYDALLDLYEEGLTLKKVEEMFRTIKPLKKLLRNILKKSIFVGKHYLEEQKYEEKVIKPITKILLKRVGYPFQRARFDRSTHPFTQEIDINDIRITTFFSGKNFRESILATMHEFGHALYELQINKKYRYTPVSGGVSLGIHESQSRFWENIIGRNKAFLSKNQDLFNKLCNESIDSLYRYFNTVKPSLIRIKADEVTYNLHIIVRYEMEKELLEEKIDVKEANIVWNEKMEKYIGIRPKNDAEGILQDIHWSQGSIGYFPTYSIGTILAVQIKNRMEKDLKEKIDYMDYTKIRKWLKDNIHKYGSVYTPEEIIRRTVKKLDGEKFLKYIEKKYLLQKSP